MNTELNLRFPDKDHVIVSFYGEESGALPFQSPITTKDREDLRWYLEVYGAHSLGDPDDEEAGRIAKQLPVLGKALFNAVFRDRAAQRLFNHFQDSGRDARLLTISSEHSAILALPWELLHDSNTGGVFLFSENPRISIRRRVAGATGGRSAVKVKSKDRLHLLFVISRPEEAGFLDPRADASAVIDAVETHAPGRFTWEVLLPPTLDALVERLQDRSHPPVDILHFDGHGVFDSDGGLPGGGPSRNARSFFSKFSPATSSRTARRTRPSVHHRTRGTCCLKSPTASLPSFPPGSLGRISIATTLRSSSCRLARAPLTEKVRSR